MDKRPVYYSMLDPLWKKVLYDINPSDGPDYLGTAGCGPTTAAMLAATFLGDKGITPVTMAQFSIAHGDRTMTNGTARSLFYHVGQAFGFDYRETRSQAEALGCLQNGGLVVCHVGPGRWTTGGHYILWWASDGRKVCINDPSGDTTKRNTGTLAELNACIKAYVCFWPPRKSAPEVPIKPEEGEEDMKYVVYEHLLDVPEWGKATVEKLTKRPRTNDPTKMVLEGGDNGELNISLDMLRILVVNDRAGVYNNTPLSH